MDFIQLANIIANDGNLEQAYRDSHTTLMSHMVRVGNLIDHAIEIEQCDVLGLEYLSQNPTSQKKKQIDIHELELYTLQYPYVSPCRPEYVDLTISEITPEIAADWIHAIEDRISPFLTHAVQCDDVIALDCISNIGIILHSFDGTIQVFDYSELSEIVVVVAHSELATTLIDISRTCEYERYINNYIRKYKTRNEFVLFYTLQFKTEDGDGFQENNSTDVLFSKGLSYGLVKSWGKYILNCAKEKSHVIILP